MKRSGRRAFFALLLILGVIALWPSLRAPLWLDDYTHAAMVDGNFPAPRGPLDLYDFVGDADRTALVHRGVLPWWTSPELKIRFFRPLSSAVLWLDHRAFAHRPFPMHLHSLAWWVALVLLAHALYARVFGPRVAFAATAMFALAPCHAVPIAWLANREALMSVAFGLAGLNALVRWREGGRVWLAFAAAFAFAMAHAAGEYALCFFGYVVGLELARARDTLARRAASLATFAVPSAAYLAARWALHYGTAGSGFYRDPMTDPLIFLEQAPRRLASLLLDVWWTLDADGWAVTTAWWGLALVVVLSALVLALPLRRAIAAQDGLRRRYATWLLVGSCLALLPVLPVAPSARVAQAAVFGAAPLAALVIDRAWFAAAPGPLSGAGQLTAFAATLLAFAQLVHGPVTSWLEGRDFRRQAEAFAQRSQWLRERVPPAARAHVVIERAGWQTVLFTQFALDEHGVPPAEWRALALANHILVLRTGARTLDVVIPKGRTYFPTGPNDLFRNSPLPEGADIEMPGLHVVVVSDGSKQAGRVRVTFDRDLDDPSFTWITERAEGFRFEPPPAIGFGKPLD